MSGAVAAHAAYNGSGTQGLAVTNKISDDGDVRSVFWNENDTTRQLLYGSAFVEVPAAGGSGTNVVSSAQNVIFDVNNDIDCLGDLVLKLSYTNGNTGNDRQALTQQSLVAAINRVEIRVGTQIWQTLENSDLLALAATELSSGAFADYSFQTSGGVSGENLYGNGALNFDSDKQDPTATLTAYIPLKLFTKTLGPNLDHFSNQSESGYLMGAAPHQHVKVKVFSGPWNEDYNGTSQSTIALSLYAKNQVMCNEEREQMKAMPMGIPKRIKMTQNKNVSFTSDKVEIDIDNFSLYASHLIISLPTPSDTEGLLTSTAELLLNSSSYSSKLPLGLLKMTGPTMGLFTNEYERSSSDNLSSRSIFVFPLASHAYGGSAVPLNRFDNIRLKLNITSGAYTTGGERGGINVTCVGETTALYKGGAASLAMY